MKNRDKIIFFLGDRRIEVGDDRCFMPLADFLRYDQSLTGTKIVCAEGDCGACTVLLANPHEIVKGKWSFKSVNSCILPVFACDGCQIVTVEMLASADGLHPVQKAMCEKFGSQCGYCTPGFVCAMTALLEDAILKKRPITEKRAKNYMTGNLCRCTGYDPIVKAAVSLDPLREQSLQERFSDSKRMRELLKLVKQPVELKVEGMHLFLPSTLAQALSFKKKLKGARIVAGATDLGVGVNKGRLEYQDVMSLQNISEMWKIRAQKSFVEISARVTLTQLLRFFESQKGFEEIVRMLHIFASPQIKNSGTLVGNLVNASPIADTIPFLLVSDALVDIRAAGRKRLIPIDEFFLGYKKLNLRGDEIVVGVRFPRVPATTKLYKVSLRKDLDISAVTMAARFQFDGDVVRDVRLAFGGVGPVVARLKSVEKDWAGKRLTRKRVLDLSDKIAEHVKPISDVRGSRDYRLLLCRNLLRKMSDEMGLA